jgi:glycoside/pentoside/hexuronide:cation symporter, GPH family
MRLARRLGRRNALLLAIALDMLMLSGWWAMPAEGAARWLLALGLLQGLVSGGVFLNIQCMLPDTMDYDAQRFGMRREGLFAGIFVMVEKFTAAIASAGFGIYIGAMGYVAAANAGTVQPESALLAIRASASLLPIGCMLAAMLALLFYRLPRTDN